MDGEKGKLSNSGSSAAGDSSGAIKPIQKPRQSQYFDDDDEEELATPNETDGSEDTIEVLEEEIRSPRHDRSEQQRSIEEMERSDSCKRSLAARATELEGELTRRQDDLTLALSTAENARAEADALRLAAKGLEGDKANLEARVRDLESEMEKVVDDMLMKEVDLRLMIDDLKVERGTAIAAAKREVASLKEELKKMEMDREKTREIETGQKEEIASLKKELVVAIEKIKEKGIEKDNARLVASEKEVEVKSLKEELKFVSEKAIEELANVKEKASVDVPHKEKVILSLKEELEIEKKKTASVLTEKEREVASLKQELMLAREKVMEEVKVENIKVVADKEVEIVLVKEQLRNAMVDAIKRKEELEKEVKELKDWNSELEGKIKGLQFKVDGDVMVQGSRGMDLTEREASKISLVTAAAVAASSGTIAAAITAFCLRYNRER